jgi:thioredoxin reductase (NADPH)
LPCKGVFIYVGNLPNSQFLKGKLEMDEKGYILTDHDMATSLKGVFACGDVRKKALRQVITACGEGAAAAFSAQQFVEEKKGIAYK